MDELNELSKDTINYINNTDINKRKKLGQYFTKKSIREELIKNLPKDILEKKHLNILDPGCGTGEFLLSCKHFFNDPILTGWDIDPSVLNVAKKAVPCAKLDIKDTIRENSTQKFDLIIGNPPYFQFKIDKNIEKEYSEIITGRTNIYGLFIYKCLNLLQEGGYLAFVIPPSMNNGAYFYKLREHLIKHSNIEFLKVLDSSMFFEGANQTVMLLILRKKNIFDKINNKFIFSKNGVTIFTEDKKKLISDFEGKLSLKELGYFVRTGRLVWNQYKNQLSNNNKHILLIWPHNIKKGIIEIDLNNKKKQYVDVDFFDQGPAIVVNRIVGQAGKAKIKAAIIEPGVRFVAENHVNVIYPQKNTAQKLSLNKVMKQLNSPDKMETIQKITGNTQLSKTELENLFPFEIT